MRRVAAVRTSATCWCILIMMLLDVVSNSRCAVQAFCSSRITTTTAAATTRAPTTWIVLQRTSRDDDESRTRMKRMETIRMTFITSSFRTFSSCRMMILFSHTKYSHHQAHADASTNYCNKKENDPSHHAPFFYRPYHHRFHFSKTTTTATSTTNLWMTTVDDDQEEEEDDNHQKLLQQHSNGTIGNKTLTSTWNIIGLRKEVDRFILRSHKKIAKTNDRLNRANEILNTLLNNTNSTLEQLEQCPDVESIELELQQIQSKLKGLNILQQFLQTTTMKKKTPGGEMILPEEMATLAISLDVNDVGPIRPVRGEKTKPKGPREMNKTRLPYRRYYSFNNIEIRVGKRAEDNDELSLSPIHRDDTDWWMHASGCPGSHVVIRYPQNNIPVPQEVLMDAATLAAHQSKCVGSIIKVTLTQCRDIRKPIGAKAGLVQLVGKVQTIVVPMNASETKQRLERLEKSVVIN